MLGELPIAIISRLRSRRGLIRAAMEGSSRSICLNLRREAESAIVVAITTTTTIILIVVIVIDSSIIIAAIAIAVVVVASEMAVLEREVGVANGLKMRVAGDDAVASVGEASPASSAAAERRTGRHGGGDAVKRERGTSERAM